MIVDAHMHIFDLHMAGKAPEGFRRFFESMMGMSLETFARKYSHAEPFVRMLDENGVDYGLVYAELAPITSAWTSNEFVLEFAAPSDRIIPVCALNPYMTPNPVLELERLVKAGARALKLYPTYQYFYPNDPLLYPLYAKAQELGIPVLAHTGGSIFPGSRIKYGDPLLFDDVAVDFPDLHIVLCHGGRPVWYEHAFYMVRNHPRVYLDVAGLPPRKLLEYWPRLETIADKVLFGTDWPGIPVPIREQVAAVSALGISEKAKEAILGRNAARLFGLPDRREHQS